LSRRGRHLRLPRALDCLRPSKVHPVVLGERLRYMDKFDDPDLPGEIQVTVTLKPVFCGTELNIVQEGLTDAIPVEACYLGYQGSLRNLPISSSPKSINRGSGP
jgi:hypothetical protein